jgi:hypothetical protein
MEAARQVVEALRRLEALERDGAEPADLLRAVGNLVDAVERWLLEEPAAAPEVRPALERCRAALGSSREVVATR